MLERQYERTFLGVERRQSGQHLFGHLPHKAERLRNSHFFAGELPKVKASIRRSSLQRTGATTIASCEGPPVEDLDMQIALVRTNMSDDLAADVEVGFFLLD
jgi:hypothetical protein